MFCSGSTQVIQNEGMPHYRQPFEKGHLVIKFTVEFPSNGFASGEQLEVGFACYFAVVICVDKVPVLFS